MSLLCALRDRDRSKKIDARLRGIGECQTTIYLDRAPLAVADLPQRPEHGGKVDAAGAEAASMGLAEVNVAERRSARADGIGERGLLDIHVEGIDHRPERRRPGPLAEW